MMQRNLMLIYFLLGFTASSAFATPAAHADFDVIVNESIHANEITRAQVKQIMYMTLFDLDKKKIVFIALSPDATESTLLDTEAMGISPIQAKKYWLTKLFNGDIANLPPTADSVSELIEKVSATPGAVAIIPKGQKLTKVKALNLK